MSSPEADEDEIPADFKAELEDRAVEVLEEGDLLTFEDHEEQRD